MFEKNKKGHLEIAASVGRADFAVWILLLVMLSSALVRYRLLDIPLDRDEGEYAYAGQLILDGIPPYKEVYSMKLPGIYAAYAMILSVFGQTHQGIHLGLLVVNELTIVHVFLLAKRLMDSFAAVSAAAVFAVLSLGSAVHGSSANAEHFVVLFALAGMLALLRALDRDSLWGILFSGILFGLAITMKQPAVAFAALAMSYVILDAAFRRPFRGYDLIVKSLFLFAGILAVLAALYLILKHTGVLETFWFWTADYATAYTGRVSLRAGCNEFIRNFGAVMNISPLLWIMVVSGLPVMLLVKMDVHRKVFLLLCVVFSFFAVCPGLYFRPHYFILLLPAAALLAAVVVYMIVRKVSCFPALYLFIPVMLVVFCVAQALFVQREFLFRMTPFQACRFLYRASPFPESLEIASYIRKHTEPDDKIAILGSEPQICFYAHRRSASGHIYMYPLTENQPFAVRMQREFIRQIEAGNPKFAVFVHMSASWFWQPGSQDSISMWWQQYCRRFEQAGIMELYEEKTLCSWYPDLLPKPKSDFWIMVLQRDETQ